MYNKKTEQTFLLRWIVVKKALLIIDVQNGMFQKGNIVHNGDKLLQTLKGLITQARNTQTPVIYAT